MSEWQTYKIRELVKGEKGAFTDGDWIEAPYITNEGIRLIQTGNIGIGRFIDRNKKYISQESFHILRCKEVMPGDLLICRLAEPIGRGCIAPKSLERFITSVDVSILKIDEERFEKSLIVQIINQDEFLNRCNEVAGGSTRQRISRTNLGDLQIEVPPLPQQRKISKILSTVDNFIEKTQALIDKYQSIKQGMMHDLFTRGVDEYGQLRPSYDEAPHLYKESELGWIPKEWECKRVGSYLTSINQGWSPDCESEPAEQGRWGVLKTTAVTWSRYDGAENKALPIKLAPRPEHEVTTGDVLVTRAGPNSRVGVVAYVYETRPMLMLSDKLYRLVPNTKVHNEFLSLALSCDRSQSNLSQRKTGLAESQTNISQSIVKEILIPVPSLPEQIDIARRVRKKDILINKEIDLHSKMKETKLGLMQDLLTGKVRVKVDA